MAKPDGPAPPDVRPAAPARVAAFRTGLSAEACAAAFLLAKGYRILARRFRTPHGEIDIVAKKRQLIAFIEVKARSRLDDKIRLVYLPRAYSIWNCPEEGLNHLSSPGSFSRITENIVR